LRLLGIIILESLEPQSRGSLPDPRIGTGSIAFEDIPQFANGLHIDLENQERSYHDRKPSALADIA